MTSQPAQTNRMPGVVRAFLRFCLSAAVLGAAVSAPAATYTRQNTTNMLNTALAWSVGGPPGTNDIAQWDGTVTTPANCMTGSSANVNLAWLGILYGASDPGANVLIPASGTSTLILGGSGINWALAGGTRNLAILCPVTLTNSQSWTAGSGLVITNMTGAMTLTNKNLTIDGAGKVVINSVITGGGTITMNNANGTLILGGINTTAFFGPVTNNAGTIKITSVGSLGSAAGSTTIASGGVLDLGGVTIAVLEPLFLSGTGISDSGAIINSSNTAATVGGGIITLLDNTALGGAGSFTLSGSITNTAYTLTKTGTGVVALAGASGSYTQAITVAGGTLKAANAAALGATNGGVTVNSGASLDIQAVVGAEPVSISGFGVASNGAILNSSATAGSLSGPVTLGGDTHMGILGTNNLTLGGKMTGDYAITKVGSGTGRLILNNTANDYTGGTTLSNGVLAASNTCLPTVGALTINGGTLAAFESQSASFTRELGTSDNQVNIPGGTSGFNGGIANCLISLSSGSDLTWDAGNFAPNIFVLNSISAPAIVNFTNAINLGSSVRKVQVDSLAYAATMSGNLTGTGGGGLEKLGAGTLILSGSNSYDGVTKVTGGLLTFGNPFAIPGGIGVSGGSSALLINGVLGLGNGDFFRGLGTGVDQCQWAPASGGFAAVNADRDVNLGGASAPLVWNVGGFVSNTFALVLGSVPATHTVDFQNPIDLGTATRTVQVDNGSAVIDATLSGVISGSAGSSLVKTGVGALLLSNSANSYPGATILGGGTLGFVSGALGSSSVITSTVASTLLWAGANTDDLSSRLNLGTLVLTVDSSNNILNFANTLGGTSGGLTKSGPGTLTLSATNKYNGLTTVSGGTLQYGIDNAIGTNAVIVNGAGAVFDMQAYTDTVGTVTLTAGSILGSGTLASSAAYVMNNAGAATCGVVLAGGASSTLTKTGAGTLTLSNPSSTFAGKTTISGASVVEIVTLANVNSPCSLGQPTTVPSGTIALGVTTSAGTLRYIGTSDSVSDRIISLSGTTAGGTLDLAGSGSLTISNFNISGAGAKALTLNNSGTGVGTLLGIITNSGAALVGVTKSGTGTWVLGGTNSYTGVTTLNGGFLSVSNIGNGGAAGNIGQAASLAGSLVLGGGTLRFTAEAGSYSTDRGFTLTTGTRSAFDVTNALTTLILNGTNTATTGSLIKNGAGTLTLAGRYLHSGATIVSNGTLKITGTLAGVGPVVVDGGILSGTNSIVGAVTNTASGDINPGIDGVAGGVLSVGRLTLNAGSVTAFEFNATPTNDLILVTNAAGLTVASGAGVYLYAEGTANSWTADGTYNLIQYAGALGGNATNLIVLNPVIGNTYAFGVSGGWLVVAIGSPASSNVWDGGSSDDFWLSAGNWASDAAPLVNGGLTFAGATRTVNTNDFPAGTRFGDLVFDPTADSFTLAGNAIALAGDVENFSANPQAITLPMTLTWTGRTFDASAGSLSVSGAIGDGSETNGLIKMGANTLTLSGPNTFDGAVTVVQGAVNIQNNAGLGVTNGGVTVAANAALQLQGAIAVGAEPLTLSGTGPANDGALRNIQDANTYGGPITLAAPTLIEADAGTLTLDVAAGNAIASTGTNVTFGGAGTVAVADPIALGAGGLIKNDAGTLILSGVNTFTGPVTLNGGILRAASSASALGTGAASLTLAGGELQLANSGGVSFGRNTTVTNDAAITSDLLASGAGVTHTNGTLSMGAFTLAVNAGANVASGNAGIAFGAATLTGDPTFDVTTNGVAGTILTLAALGDGGVGRTITKSGSGTLTLGTLATSLTNGTLVRVTDGRLNANIAGALGTLATVDVADGAILGLGAAQTIAALSNTNSVLNNGSVSIGGAYTLTVGGTNNFDSAFSGVISGTNGALTKAGAGTLTLSGGNTYGGITTISAGRLVAGHPYALSTNALTQGLGILELACDTSVYSNALNMTVNPSLITVNRATPGPGVAHTLGALATGSNRMIVLPGTNVTSGSATLAFGAVTLSSTATFDVSNGVDLILGPLVGPNTIMVKEGAGRLLLNTAASTRTAGPTTLNGGTLVLGGIVGGTYDSLGNGGAILMNTGTLVFATDTSSRPHTGNIVGGDVALVLDRATAGDGITNVLLTAVVGPYTLTVTAGTNVTGGTAGLTFGTTTLAGNPTFNIMTNGAGADTLFALSMLTDTNIPRTIVKSGPGALALTGGSTLTNGTVFRVTEGRLNLTAAAALGSLAVVDVDDGAVVNVSAAQTFGALSNTNGVLGTGSVVLGASLTVGASNNLESVFSGVISGAGGLTKGGSGTLTLSGANLYSGLTAVSAGTLLVSNATGSATGPGIVNVNSNATLAGNGTCSGVVSNKSFGTVAPGLPGVAGGVLTVGSLSLAAGSTNTFEFAAAPDTNDQIAVSTSGGLTISGGDVLLMAAGTTNAWAVDGTYTLATFTGALNGSPSALVVRNPAQNKVYTFDTVTGSPNRLTVTINNAKTWSGLSGDNGNWSTDDNWFGGAPVATDIVVFAGNGGNWLTNNNNDMAAGTPFDGIIFNGGSAAFSLSGNLLNLAGNVVNYSTNIQTIALPMALDSGSRIINTVTGAVVVAAPVGEANGSNGLIKNGTNYLTLAAANTFSGGVTLNAGILNLNDAAAPGTGLLTLNGGTLDNASGAELALAGDVPQLWNASFAFKGSTNLDLGAGAVSLPSNVTVTTTANKLTVGGVISGLGRLTKAGSGVAALQLCDSNTFTGGFTQSGGATVITKLGNGNESGSLGASDSSAANLTLSGGILAYEGPTASSDRNINITGNVTLELFNPTSILTLSGSLPNNGGSLSLGGPGTVELTGTNVWIGTCYLTPSSTTSVGGRTMTGAKMLANGAVAGSNFRVYGGSLAGTGSVTMTGWIKVDNNGKVTPGIDGQAGGVLSLTAPNEFTFVSSSSATFEFNAFTNDMVDVVGSVGLPSLCNVRLYEEGTTNAWNVNGEYKLIHYSGSITNGGVQNLTVANPAADTTYAFFQANNWIMVRVVGPFGPVWDGGGSDDNWQTTANWDPDGALNLFDALTFAGTTRLAATNDYVGLTNGGLWFSDTPLAAGSFTLSGNAITLAGSVVNDSAMPQTVDLPMTLKYGNRTFEAASNDLAVTGMIDDGAETNGIVKAGANTLTLSGANSFKGAVTVNAGALKIQHATGLGTTNGGVTVVSGAALQLQGGIAVGAEPLALNGLGLANDGALRNILDANTYGGPITLAGPSLIEADAGLLTLDVASGNAITATGTNVTFGGAGDITVADPIVIGIGALTKNDAGTLLLAHTNTYTGLTTVNGGTLRYGCSNAISTGPVTVNGGTLDLVNYVDSVGAVTMTNGVITATAGSLTSTADFVFEAGEVNSPLAGAVGVIKHTSGTVTLSRASTFTGASRLNRGVLRATSSGLSLGTGAATLTLGDGELQLANDTPLNYTRNTTVTNNTTITSDLLTTSGAGVSHTNGTLSIGSFTMNVNGGSNTVSGTAGLSFVTTTTLTGNPTFNVMTNGSGADTLLTLGGFADGAVARTITKTGAGTLTLGTAASSLVNGTRVQIVAGRLNSALAAALGSLAVVDVADNSVLGVNASQTFGALSNTNAVLANGSVLFGGSYVLTVGGTNNLDSAFSGVISGNGSLVKAGRGTLTLSGANLYAGYTAISNGMLLVGNDSGSGTGPGVVNVNAAGTLAGNGFISGVVSNKSGGTVAPGLPGTAGGLLTVGRLSLAAGSSNIFEFAASPDTNDQIAVTVSGGLTISGGDVLLVAAGTTTPWEIPGVYTLATYTGALNGSPANLTVKNPGAGKSCVFDVIEGSPNRLVVSISDSKTWSGASGDNGKWSTGENWDGGVPVATDLVAFAGNGGNWLTNNTNDIAAGTRFDGILFNPGSSAFKLSGNLVNLHGNVVNFSTNLQTIALPLALDEGIRSVYAVSGSVALLGDISEVNGAGTLLKQGTNALTLAGANTFSGGVTLNAGILNVGNAASLGTGPLTLNGGSLDNVAGVDLALTGDNAQTWNANFIFKGSAGLDLGASAVTMTTNISLTTQSTNDLRVGGVISGPYRLTYSGVAPSYSNSLTLAGANTFSGGMALSGSGTLRLTTLANGGQPSSIGASDASADNFVLGGGYLMYAGDSVTIDRNLKVSADTRFAILNPATVLTLNGNITNTAGALITTGLGTLVLNGSDVQLGGTCQLSGGYSSIDNYVGLGRMTLVANGNIRCSNALTLTYQNILAGTGTVSTVGRVSLINGTTMAPGTPGQAGGTLTVNASPLIFTNGCNLAFEFDAVTNDMLIATNVNSLAIGTNVNISLREEGTADTWKTNGIYKLIQYTGTIQGALTNLVVSNPQPDTTYTFFTEDSWVKVRIMGPYGRLWDGEGSDDSWSTGSNWNPDGSPLTYEALTFAGTTRLTPTNDMVGLTNGGLIFADTPAAAGAFTLDGNPITLAGSVVNKSLTAQTVNLPLVLAFGSRTFNTASNDLTVNGVISDDGNTNGLIKTGSNTLVLAGNNTYGGLTVVATGGVINVRHDNGLGAEAFGTVVSNGATLQLQGGITIAAEPLTLRSTGLGISSNGGLCNKQDDNTFSGPISLGAASRINTEAGSLTLNAASPITNVFALSFGGSGTTVVSTAINTGTGTFFKDGSGKLVLASANGFSGAAIISGGTLEYGCDNAFAGGAITITGSNTVFDLGGYNDTIGPINLRAGAITGTGTLTIASTFTSTSLADASIYCSAILAGTGSVTKGGGIGDHTFLTATNTYTGITHVQGGTLSVSYLANGGQPSGIGASSSEEGNVVVNSSVFEYTGPSVTIDRNMTMGSKVRIRGFNGYTGSTDHDEGQISVTDPGTTLTLLGALYSNTNATGTALPVSFFYKLGAGTLELAATNQYVGETGVLEGTLKVTGLIPATNSAWPVSVYPLTVDSNATVSGVGVIDPLVQVNTLGTIKPGADLLAGSSLTVGGLTLQENAIAVFKFSSVTNDSILVTGSDNVSLAPVQVYLYEEGTVNPWASNGVYNLIQYAGAILDGDVSQLMVANPASGKSYSFGLTPGWITLTITDGSVWDGGGADDNWQATPANWSGDLAPAAGDGLTFAGSVRLTPANDFAANTVFRDIVFDATAGAFTLGGNAVNLLGNVINLSTNEQTLAIPLVLDTADRAFNTAASNILVTGMISDGGNTLGIRKTGPFALTLSGANTYGGGTYIDWGFLRLGASEVIPNGPGKGNLTVSTATTALDMAGYNETVNGLFGAGYVYNTTNSATLTIGDNDVSSTNTIVFLDYGGTLSLAKIGNGVLSLGVASPYTGGTIVDNGTLRAANTNGSATGSGAVRVASGATLDGNGILDGATTTLAGGATVNPGVNGAGMLTVDGLAWSNNAILKCEVVDLNGTVGLDYDNLYASGTIGPATPGDKLIIRLDSMGASLTVPSEALSLRVLTAPSMGSLDLADYALETNDFLTDGTWTLTNIENSIYVISSGAVPTNVWVGSGDWSEPANWSNGIVPQVGSVVIFNNAISGNCIAGFNTVNGPLASITLEPDYDGTVTFKKGAVASGMTLTLTGDLAVNAGTMVMEGDPAAVGAGTVDNPYGVGYTIQAASVTVASGASLNADNTGFGALQGPGNGFTFTTNGGYAGYYGASHGGYGGLYDVFTNPVPRYGSPVGPTELGSGGSVPGGGAIRLKVPGLVTINGVLSASCVGLDTNRVTGGSGGSIWIDGATLEGSGLIQANGLSITNYVGGGGGRIDISNTTNNFAGTLEVLGGYGSWSTSIFKTNTHTLRKGMAGSIVFPQSAGSGLTLDVFSPYTNLTFGNSLTLGTMTVANGITVKVQAYNDETVVTCGLLTVESNGTIVCLSDYYAANVANGGTPNNPYGQGVTLAGSNITIDAGGRIHADNEGFTSAKYAPFVYPAVGTGPGGASPNNYSAPSYGGQPGGSVGSPDYCDITKRRAMYGTAIGPTALGSGGNQHDASGGGAIKLAVSGTVTVNGVLSASSPYTGNSLYVSPSGGSLWITGGTLAGNGRILANAGDNQSLTYPNYGCGGGGRIDISGTTNNFIGIIQARGGNGFSAFARGQAGSVVLPASAGLPGNTLADFRPTSTNFIFGNSLTFGDCVVSNGVVLTLDANEGQNEFTFNSLTIQSGGEVRCMGNLLAVNPDAGGVTNDIRGAGVTLIVSNLTIEAGGSLNADGNGFDGVILAAAHPTNAAAYGGLAGTGVGQAYGSLSNLTALGCGTNATGGGAIRIVAAGAVIVNGVLSCDGASTNASGASGGSLWIDCDTLQGSGVISASGSGATNKVGGGGGRIHVLYNTVGSPNPIDDGTVAAFGGGMAPESKGAAGTVLLVNRGSAESLGTLLVANNGAAVNTVTPLSTSEDLSLDRAEIKSGATLQLPADRTLTLTTAFANQAAFSAGSNSTVALAGTNDAVVSGSSTFENLRIADAVKTVRFEAGATSTVTKGLAFANATLLSTTDGAWWYLNSAATASQSVQSVKVKDSNAGGGATIDAREGQNGNLGHNVNWLFPPAGTLIIIR